MEDKSDFDKVAHLVIKHVETGVSVSDTDTMLDVLYYECIKAVYGEEKADEFLSQEEPE